MDVEIKRVARIEEEPGLLCYDDCIATIANYYNRDYELIYSDFCEIKKNNIHEKVFFASQYIMKQAGKFDNLEKYHGIRGKEIILNDDKWIDEINYYVAKNKPILVFFDPYWCPWDSGFQKFHNDSGHSFIIKDINIKDETVSCVDPYFNINSIDISFEYFLKGVKCIEVFEKCDINEITVCDYENILLNIHKKMIGMGYYDTLELLLDDMKESNNLFNEIECDEVVWSSPLIVFLMLINQSISSLAIETIYISEKVLDNKLKESGHKIWNLAVQWKQVRKLLVKLYFIRKTDNDLRNRLLDKMYYVISELRQISLHCIIGKEDIEIKSIVTNTKDVETEETCQMISIEKYFNNKGFGDVNNKYRADFTSAGHFYIINDCFDKKHIWDADNVFYDMNRIYKEENDNIACDGQEVQINTRGYSYLYVLGAAEFGGSTDIMRFEYEGGSAEVAFEFIDYIYKPQYGEKTIWKGQGAYCGGSGKIEIMEETLYLYVKSYRLRKDLLKSIVLPINPSMHIFALSLTN